MKRLERRAKGITLVALVVTIIVLLILAGIAINLTVGNNGLFKRAENATEKYGEAKAREMLEIVFGALQVDKYAEGLTEESLDARITEEINKMGGEETVDNKNEVVVEGYRFKIDRTVPKVIEVLGSADGVIISAVIIQNGDWKNPRATVTGLIKTYSGGTITSSTAEVIKGSADVSGFTTNGGNFTLANIAVDTDITITATDSNNKTNTRTIHVVLVKDTTAPTISEEKVTTSGLTITISAKATDNQSKIECFKYKITPTTGLTTSEGDLPQNGTPVTITSTEEATYTVILTAKDNATNTTTKEITEMKTVDGGVIKHIKTTTGLKEVNTKDIYGATVTGYTAGNSNWQIFYIDETKNSSGEVTDSNVYLIASDYLSLPTKITDTGLTKGGYSKTYYWNETGLTKGLGTIPDNSFTQKFLADYKGEATKKQVSLQATNYMLNQEIWGEYLDTSKADYAFWGPTLPLFQASYNDICKAATKLGILKYTQGYMVSIGGGSWGDIRTGFGTTETQKGIYFKGTYDGNSCCAMYMASPSQDYSHCLRRTQANGTVGFHGYNSNETGFRPVVCLNSNVQFTYNESGTYVIN